MPSYEFVLIVDLYASDIRYIIYEIKHEAVAEMSVNIRKQLTVVHK